ncbi:MAG: hypothetical protein HY897_19415 [Deltaproteobacteria bacterium]|nr:hypothetical protein [Deltaproteobacteria bacterium]
MKKREWREMVVLPWLTLNERVTFNGIEFHPCARRKTPDRFKPYRTIIRNIISGYSVDTWSGVAVSGKDSCSETTVAEFARILDAVNALAVCSISTNRFYEQIGENFNSSYFEVHTRRFDHADPEWRADQYRKREWPGGVAGLAKCTNAHLNGERPPASWRKRNERRFTVPFHVQLGNVCRFDDKGLLTAIEKAYRRADSFSRRLTSAINLFNEANTCRDTVREEWEIVLMASAIEHLLGANGNEKVGERVGHYFGTYSKVTAGCSKRATDLKYKNERRKKVEFSWSLAQKWTQELYVLRSNYIHGADVMKLKWGWSRQEHLVMGAYFFPLLIKAMLAHDGLYTMTDGDGIACELVDVLLNERDWGTRVRWYHTRWRQVVIEYSRDRRSQLRRQKISLDLGW